MKRLYCLLILMLFGLPVLAVSAIDEHFNDLYFETISTDEVPLLNTISIVEDKSGFLWLGTNGDLFRYDGYHFQSFLESRGDSERVNALWLDADERLWLGGEHGGLSILDPAEEKLTYRDDFPEGSTHPTANSIRAFASDAMQGLWIGTDQGISIFIVTTQVVTENGVFKEELSADYADSRRFQDNHLLTCG